MIKIETETFTVTEDVIKDVLCNMCGNSCQSELEKEDGVWVDKDGRTHISFYGLIEAEVSGGYFSPHLSDMISYKFSICEKCILDLFSKFKIPPTEDEYNFG